METDKEGNKMVLEHVTFHLIEAMRFFSQLDPSKFGGLGQKERDEKIRMCKNALEFTKDLVENLSTLLA